MRSYFFSLSGQNYDLNDARVNDARVRSYFFSLSGQNYDLNGWR